MQKFLISQNDFIKEILNNELLLNFAIEFKISLQYIHV